MELKPAKIRKILEFVEDKDEAKYFKIIKVVKANNHIGLEGLISVGVYAKW